MSVFFAILTPMVNPLIYSEKKGGEKCHEDFIEEESNQAAHYASKLKIYVHRQDYTCKFGKKI